MQSSIPTAMDLLILLPLLILPMMPTTNNRLTKIHPRNNTLPMLRVTQTQPRSDIAISRGSIFSVTSPPGNRCFILMHISTASIWCSEFSESSYFVLALCLHTMLWVKQAHQNQRKTADAAAAAAAANETNMERRERERQEEEEQIAVKRES